MLSPILAVAALLLSYQAQETGANVSNQRHGRGRHHRPAARTGRRLHLINFT